MADDATASALSDMSPQPTANPDAQTTVNDFLDYTEFFPSDLIRSLRLIRDLDSNYLDATEAVHELTKTYGNLPHIPESERPRPQYLRKEIAAQLDQAVYCRESTYAEAARLYEVAERHCHRLKIIKRKLQALPQPPSRDPTPAPVSPQATRSANRGYERTPRIHLHFDGGRHGASSTARPRDRSRKPTAPLPRALSLDSLSSSDMSDAESEVRSTIDLATAHSPKKIKEKTPKPPKPARFRMPGSQGTNVHSSIAGISTSNALAKLSPPPADARPGSKFAPWFKLTEYEMAVLRKQMKKNAIWCPSDTMIRRELERKGRGHVNYDKEKARCEATGEEFIDEDLEEPSVPKVNPPALVNPNPPADAAPPTPNPAPAPVEPPKDTVREDTATVNKGMKLNEAKEAKKVKRESQREQAMRDAQGLEDATRKIKEAAENLKELNFASDSVNVTPTAQRRKSTTKTTNKRKRECTPPPPPAADTPTTITREASSVSQDSGTKPPDPKRLRLQNLPPLAPAPAPAPTPVAPTPATVTTPKVTTPIITTPVVHTPIPLPDPIKTITVQVPLAPAGPSTPKSATKPASTAPSRHVTPALPSPTQNKKPQEAVPTLAQPTQPTVTAASSRPRRESVASKVPTPPPAPVEPVQPPKARKTPTPAPEPVRSSPGPVTRPRSSRGHMPTPKAQSEEPKLNDLGRNTRELRRHSIFSQSAVTATPVPTRMSTRKKPPPKGDITSAEDGQKTVTNVKRAQGSKNKKKKKADEEPTEPLEEIDPNEPRYCICDDVSFGQMIQCDNNCEKEWFHLDCVHMTEKEIPSRRAKWYCPDCRAQLGTDAYGNPLVPPALPGRRGNR
ncbi:uncharacterized protein BDR25DRAFT_271676 [Lindgomyces ingoldianus]|uniref:Uncharacterized protein n=1 Tax=Lindgomyces ingoldianus TaxID=673940 RepID=A0ACB6QCK4_9PLEO|nr:uncharacterized protein BDR25DRAFT_271676 [Lindgomyces ingoldianus]KAF2464641.1 hypothetical protein BDR25DRAFT_271676 [Lindgomyces ingoldianus]